MKFAGVAAGVVFGALWISVAADSTGTAPGASPAAAAGTLQTPQAAQPRPRRPPRAVIDRQTPPIVIRDPNAVTEPPAPPPETNPSTSKVRITPDGYIEERLADGGTKLSRPGECGWKIVRNGKTTSVQCATQVPKLNLPVPSGDVGTWLDSHADALLGIARGLLGPNASSLDYYVTGNEADAATVYDRIRLRTSVVQTLSAAVAGQ